MTVLELTHTEARKYFLLSSTYSNIDLPKYFTFDKLLLKTSKKLGSSNIRDFFHSSRDPVTTEITSLKPGDFEDVNYLLLGNKDGEYSWRPYELIHPALYVSLVHLITEEANWEIVKNRFRDFSSTGIHCESIPVLSDGDESGKAKQIKNWWTNVEQRALSLGLKYQYTFDADITNCYGAIYTHSISWAIHTKSVAKVNRKDDSMLGNQIDRHFQMMHADQTNGIPQGSGLTDFIAEIILGYVDELLYERIKSSSISDYEIIRYRDDYKVLTNSPEDGRRIIKLLSEVLSTLGMKLNTDKTKQKTDPILAAVKDDKLDELFIPKKRKSEYKNSMQKWLLQIYVAANKHPNSGKVSRLVTRYYDALDEIKKLNQYDNPLVMLSIIVNLASKNPRSYQWTMAIISKLLEFCESSMYINLIDDIKIKFDRVPNTALLDIWLQRISYKIDPSIQYPEAQLTSLISSVTYPGNTFWQSSWLDTSLANIVIDTPIIEKKILHEMKMTIERAEVELFKRFVNS